MEAPISFVNKVNFSILSTSDSTSILVQSADVFPPHVAFVLNFVPPAPLFPFAAVSVATIPSGQRVSLTCKS